jgi:hypothetical protein
VELFTKYRYTWRDWFLISFLRNNLFSLSHSRARHGNPHHNHCTAKQSRK